MADTVDGDPYENVDVESILSRVERRPLTFTKKRSLCQAPEFLKRLCGEDTINEGGDMRLECKVVGFPKPSLRWYRDDEEITHDDRYTFEEPDTNSYTVSRELVSKCDEGSYKCKAENGEGAASSLIFVQIKGKSGSRSPKKGKSSSQSPSRRTVSFPPLIPTIVERIVEEEKAAAELETLPPSPLTPLYDGVTMKQKNVRPQFLGDWAFVNGVINGHPDVFSMDDDDDMVFLTANREGVLQDSSPSDDSKSESESDSPEETRTAEIRADYETKLSGASTTETQTAKDLDSSYRGNFSSPVDIKRSIKTKFANKIPKTNISPTAVLASGPIISLPSISHGFAPPTVPSFNQQRHLIPVCKKAPISAPDALPQNVSLPSQSVLPTFDYSPDSPRSSSRPLCTRRLKPKKLIVRKRHMPSPSDLCNGLDFGELFLLVTFFTFVSLWMELNLARFLPMMFTGYAIFSFIKALMTESHLEQARKTNSESASSSKIS